MSKKSDATTAWKAANREKNAATDAAYRLKNREKERLRAISWYRANKERRAVTQASWQRENTGKVNAITAKRRATKALATPSWLTKEDLVKIEQFYLESAKLTLSTGIRHNVDHIIPLQGKNVSGLHVPWNLQILTKQDNSSKGNRVLGALPVPKAILNMN